MSTWFYNHNGYAQKEAYFAPSQELPRGWSLSFFGTYNGSYRGAGFRGTLDQATYEVKPFSSVHPGRYEVNIKSTSMADFNKALNYCLRRIGFEVENYNPTLPALESFRARLSWLARWLITGK